MSITGYTKDGDETKLRYHGFSGILWYNILLLSDTRVEHV